MKKFGELTREEQLALFEDWLGGKTIQVFLSQTGAPQYYFERSKWFEDCIALTKPSINWDHVHPDYKWLATDEDGITFLFGMEPKQGSFSWVCSVDSVCVKVNAHSSFKAGTCDWKDSLVKRPE